MCQVEFTHRFGKSADAIKAMFFTTEENENTEKIFNLGEGVVAIKAMVFTTLRLSSGQAEPGGINRRNTKI